MRFEENGERIKDLKLILSRVAYAAALWDTDGISVRFMNSRNFGIPVDRLDNIRTGEQAEALITPDFPFQGLTPLGTELKNQVIQPMVLGPMRAGQLKKPVLVITITDGQPAGEARTMLKESIIQLNKDVAGFGGRYGTMPCSFQIAQVGNDQGAKAFLAELDTDPEVGQLVDCVSSEPAFATSRYSAANTTSDYETEQEEYTIKHPQTYMTPDMWVSPRLHSH